MEIQNYINAKKKFYKHFMRFIDNSNENVNFIDNDKLFNLLENQQVDKNKEELQLLLRLISKISKNHHRTPNFFNKIEQILLYYKDKIKQTFSNSEIFNIFKSSKLTLLYLIENEIIIIDETIARLIFKRKHQKYCHFFYPELKPFISSEKRELFEKELFEYDPDIFEKFEENRKKGENYSYICQLIQNDSIDDFISYVNHTNFSLKNSIKPSIFETNSFLLKNEPTLIEYAAFYGSIEIFQYLRLNNVFLSEKLWLYSIHGRNAEIIHLLEESGIEPEDKSYRKCIEESVKCHHNEIANYFNLNLADLNENYGENIVDYGFHHNNYEFIQNNSFAFFYACQYDYLSIVKFFLKTGKLNVNAKIISNI